MRNVQKKICLPKPSLSTHKYITLPILGSITFWYFFLVILLHVQFTCKTAKIVLGRNLLSNTDSLSSFHDQVHNNDPIIDQGHYSKIPKGSRKHGLPFICSFHVFVPINHLLVALVLKSKFSQLVQKYSSQKKHCCPGDIKGINSLCSFSQKKGVIVLWTFVNNC